MAQSEKRYCPVCKQRGEEKTTFICQDSGGSRIHISFSRLREEIEDFVKEGEIWQNT